MIRVLVARVGGIGDSIAVLPVLLALQRDRPDLALTVLLSPVGAAVVKRALVGVRVVTVSRLSLSGVSGLSRVPALVRHVGCQDIALLSYDETTAVQVLAACVATRRVGFSAGISRGECLLTDPLPFDPRRSIHDILYDLARFMGGVCPDCQPPHLPGRLCAGNPYGELHVRAATFLQEWSAMPQLVPWMEWITGFPWIIRRGVEDGRSVEEFVAGIAGACAVVSLHSGPLHLAAALGVPVAGIAGPTARAWDPPGVPVLRLGPDCQPCGFPGVPARICRRGDHACLSALLVQDVADRVCSVLGYPTRTVSLCTS